MRVKILIDEQLSGCGLLLRTIGYDVVLSNELGLQRDEELIEYAVKNDMLMVTEDNGMATVLHGDIHGVTSC